MRIRRVEGIEGAREAEGDVVVFDVLRAFTTAAYAFAAGLDEIEIVATVEEAFRRPGFRMGEVGGEWIPGFDHNNAPSTLAGRRLSGRGVLRSGAGARCAVEATRASRLWISSLVVLSATARAVRGCDALTLVISGAPDEGEEDRAAALCFEAIVRGEPMPRSARRTSYLLLHSARAADDATREAFTRGLGHPAGFRVDARPRTRPTTIAILREFGFDGATEEVRRESASMDERIRALRWKIRDETLRG